MTSLNDASPGGAPGVARPVGFLTEAGYGLGLVPAGILLTGLGAATLQYYINQVIGAPPILTGLLILASLTIDAICDPLIGQWSDRFRSPLGRRHPFMYAGAVLMAVTFYFLWHAPANLSGQSLFIYMLVLLVAVRMSQSLHDISSNGLVPELAPDYDKRTVLISFRWFFLVIGLATMSYLLLAVFLKTDAHNTVGLLNRAGYARFGAFASLLLFLTAMTSALSTQRRAKGFYSPPPRPFRLGDTARVMVQTLTNPALLVLLMCGLFGGIGAGMRGGLDQYFYTHLWGLKPQQIGIILPMGVLGSVVAVIVAPIMSRLLGKKMTMIVFFVFSTIVSLLPMTLKVAGLMPANSSGWVFAILIADAVVVAILAVAGLVIVSSMVADVVEDNAVKTGERSEGLLFAANGLLPKFSAGIGAVMAGVLLSVVHFPAHALQGTVPPALMRELTLIFLPIYAIIVSISIFVLLFYRIDRGVHERNLERLSDAAALAATAEQTAAML